MPRNSRPTCPPKTAVAYARYSSAGQRDVSIDQQLQDIRAFAQREGYTIVHEYADHAKSGYKSASSRAQFQAMLSDAAVGGFDTIIAWKVDRFGRNRRDSAVYKGQLRDLGVRVIYAMEPIPDGAAGVLTEGMLESIAEWYSRNLAENVMRGMSDNASKALHNGTPFLGYRRGPDGHYQTDPEGAALVRQIFDRYLAGYSAGSIAKHLNDLGLRTDRGALFNVNIVLRVISNRRYTGVYIWNDIEVPGGMPRIISDRDYEEAQKMRKKTGRHHENNPAEFLLTGKAFCGLCGRPMVGDSGKSKTGTVYYYYTCIAHKGKNGLPKACAKKSVRRDHLEKTVLDFIYDRCLTGPEMEKIADAILAAQAEEDKKSPRAAMAADLKDTERRIDNLNNAIAEGIWNSSTSVKLKSLEDTAESLRASIAELDFSRSQLLDRDRILFFLSKMATYNRDDPVRQKQLIATFINAVFVYDDHLKIVINAVEGNATITLDQLPSDDPPESSDSVSFGSLRTTHPNPRIVVYTIAV